MRLYFTVDLIIPVNQFGVHACIVLTMTHVTVLEIPVHQVHFLVVLTQIMLLWNAVSVIMIYPHSILGHKQREHKVFT